MKNCILFFSLLLTATISAQVTAPYVVDFERHNAGTYTTAMAKLDFPKADWYYGMDEGRSEIVDENGNKVLRLKYPAGCVGPNDTPIGCGMQVKWYLPETADTMWLSYRIKFEDGFEFVKGGKLPGLCGGKCYTGGTRPQQGDGWSARIMWREGGRVVQYLYFTEQASIYGDDMKWDYSGTQKVFTTGVWHTVLTQVVLNDVPKGSTTGRRNGIVRSWFDGEPALDVDTLRLVDSENQKIDMFYISTFFGGDDNTWAPTKDCYIRYDDFWISKNAPENMTTNVDFFRDGQKKSGFVSYPNPATNELRIQAYKPIHDVKIFSLLGNPILQCQSTVIGISDLETGIYFLYVTFEDGSTSNTKFSKL